MIDLSTLTEDEQKVMLHNLERPRTMKYSKANYKRPAVNALVKEFGKKYEKELWVIVTFTATCQRYDTAGFRISLYAKQYELSNAVTKQGISVKKMSTLLELLDAGGYITFLKGYAKSKTKYARSAAIIKPKLDEMINRKKSKTLAVSREDQYDTIEVVDIENTKVSKHMIGGVLHKTKSVVLLETKGKAWAGLATKRQNLRFFNKQVESSVITIKDKVDNRIVFKQRFEGSLDLCGRYWCGRLQQIGSDESKEATREDIRIDGIGTFEADYKTIQPRCLYLEEGIVLAEDFDVYGTDLTIGNMTKEEVRTFIKKCMFSILFSADRKSAKASITGKIKDNGLTGLVTSEQVVSAMEEKNAPIAHRFYNKTYYRVLQNYEARMAEYVINYFTAKGITVLPWHDSFVIQHMYGEELVDVMHKAWQHVMNTKENCVVDIEFDTAPTQEVVINDEQIPLSAYSDYDFQETQEDLTQEINDYMDAEPYWLYPQGVK